MWRGRLQGLRKSNFVSLQACILSVVFVFGCCLWMLQSQALSGRVFFRGFTKLPCAWHGEWSLRMSSIHATVLSYYSWKPDKLCLRTKCSEDYALISPFLVILKRSFGPVGPSTTNYKRVCNLNAFFFFSVKTRNSWCWTDLAFRM